MKKLMELKKRKKNNKGFSLVELIIVIAIMAVLVAVLAPQFLKYVEKSRNSSDLNNISSIITAAQTYYIDPDNTTAWPTSIAFTVAAKDTKEPVAPLLTALTNAGLTPANITCKSKTAWTAYTITFKPNSTTNTLDVEVALTGASEDALNTAQTSIGSMATVTASK